MKTKIKLAALKRENTTNEQMSHIRGGTGTCECLCDGDISGESRRGCKKAENTGCTLASLA